MIKEEYKELVARYKKEELTDIEFLDPVQDLLLKDLNSGSIDLAPPVVVVVWLP